MFPTFCPALYVMLVFVTGSILSAHSLFSLCDERYLRTAFYFKTIEGFLEAGPQVALQLSLLFRGNWTRSDQLALEPILPVTAINATDVIPETDDLEVLGRVYDAGKNLIQCLVIWYKNVAGSL